MSGSERRSRGFCPGHTIAPEFHFAPFSNHPLPPGTKLPASSAATSCFQLSHPQTQNSPTGPFETQIIVISLTPKTHPPSPARPTGSHVTQPCHEQEKVLANYKGLLITGLGEHPFTCLIMRTRIGHEILTTHNKHRLILKLA